MDCESCGKKTSKKCESCKSAYYCSKECLEKDWNIHKKFCLLYKKTKFKKNPFYNNKGHISPPPNSHVFNTHGETPVHLAIINNDIELLKKVCTTFNPSTPDFRNNSPLYYVVTHPKVLDENKGEMIKILLDNYADPFMLGGYSGRKFFELIEDEELFSFVENHPTFIKYEILRREFNTGKFPLFVDIYWRDQTIYWHYYPSSHSFYDIIPHPKILDLIEKGKDFDELVINNYKRTRFLMDRLILSTE